MRIASARMVLLLLAGSDVIAADMKAPAGCVPAGGATPDDGSPHLDDGLMTKSVRGGAWTAAMHGQAGMARTRFNTAPGNTHNDLGFRVVLRLPPIASS